MTNADLIAELSRYPAHVPVKVVLSNVYVVEDDSNVQLCREDAIESSHVVYEGAFILIESK